MKWLPLIGLILILGCTGEKNNITLTELNADPFSIIHIEMSNIDLTAYQTLVRFYNNEYNITVPALNVTEKVITAPVPPYAINNEFTSGNVSISVEQLINNKVITSKEAKDFTINDLPETNVTPGSITLNHLKGLLNATINIGLQTNNTKYDKEETGEAILTDILILTLVYTGIENVMNTGEELYFGTIKNDDLMINNQSLHNNDRLLLGLYKAQSEVKARTPGEVRFAGENSEPGCMAQEAKGLAETVEYGYNGVYYANYFDAPIKSINCKISEAVIDGMKVTIGSGGVGAGLLGLIGATSVMASAAILNVQVQIGGGLILLGGLLGQQTAGAKTMVAEGYNQLTQAGQILTETITANVKIDPALAIELPEPFQDLKDVWSNLEELQNTLLKQEGIEKKFVKLTIYRDGDDYGVINVNKYGLTNWGACTHKCTILYEKETEITLSEVPGELTFNGFSGDCAGTNECNLIMNSDKEIHTTWDLDLVKLTINRLGDNYPGFRVIPGVIYSNLANCTNECIAYYERGTNVRIILNEEEGKTFKGWSGDCTGISDCLIKMDEDKTVNADYTTETVTLTVNRLGTYYGSFQINNVPILSSDWSTCTRTCTAVLVKGAQVTLTPTENDYAKFTNWSGDCTGTGDCVLVMNSNKTVNENFGTETQEEEITGDLSISMTSNYQTSVKASGYWGTECSYTITTSGTASGPVSAKVHIFGAGDGIEYFSFNGWTKHVYASSAQRLTGDSESTTWTSSYTLSCLIGDEPLEVYATVSLIGPTGINTVKETSKEYYECTC